MEVLNHIELIVGSVLAIIGLVAAFRKHLHEWFLSLSLFKKNKAEIKTETTVSEDQALELLKNRVNSLGSDFVDLSEKLVVTQKELYQVKSTNIQLKFEHDEMKKLIANNCLNNCLKNVG